MKKIILLIFCLITGMVSAQGYDYEYLRIGNVQQSWATQNGSFDTVVFEVKPKGLLYDIIYLNNLKMLLK